MTLQCLIIDANPHSRDEVNYLLQPYPDIGILAEVATGMAGLELTRQLKPNFVFLDIKMPDITGLEYAKIVRQELKTPPGIIFISAHKEHALECYNYQAIHYLLKPIDITQFLKAITWVRKLHQPYLSSVAIRGLDASTFYLPTNNIIYISHKNAMTTVHTRDSKYQTRTSLIKFYAQLKGNNFTWIQRNCIVNRSYDGVMRLMSAGAEGGGDLVITDCDELLPVSRKYYKQWNND